MPVLLLLLLDAHVAFEAQVGHKVAPLGHISKIPRARKKLFKKKSNNLIAKVI